MYDVGMKQQFLVSLEVEVKQPISADSLATFVRQRLHKLGDVQAIEVAERERKAQLADTEKMG